MYDKTKYLTAGDKGLIIEFGNEISKPINEKIRSMVLAIEKAGLTGLSELVPTYRSLLVYYDPLQWSFLKLVQRLQELESELASLQLPQPKVTLLPVLYGGEYGPDLPFVCEHAGLSPEEVIKIHTSRDYLIYMLGFTPGFPYLGGMDERIATPRLQNPRTKIPPGSVGIAGSQTGVYPIESPGGWQLIGRTPVKLYDPHRAAPVLLAAGDYVRFYSIDETQYQEISKQCLDGTFQVQCCEYQG